MKMSSVIGPLTHHLFSQQDVEESHLIGFWQLQLRLQIIFLEG